MSSQPSTLPADPTVPAAAPAMPLEQSFYSSQAFQTMKVRLSELLKKSEGDPETKGKINTAYQRISMSAKNLKIDDPQAADNIGWHSFIYFKDVVGAEVILNIIRNVLPKTYEKLHARLTAQAQAAAAAAANTTTAAAGIKRAAASGPGDLQPVSKRARAGEREIASYDYDEETNKLMGELTGRRITVTTKAVQTPSHILSDWRVQKEILMKGSRHGIKTGQPDCFDVIQLAFKAHMTGFLKKAASIARHKSDPHRRDTALVELAPEDPRVGLRQIAEEHRRWYEAKVEAEQEALMKMAGSKRADEETRERAQRFKAEQQEKQQQSAANAALRSAFGGASDRTSKWGAGAGGAKKTAAEKKAEAAAAKEAAAAAEAAKNNAATLKGGSTAAAAGGGGAESSAAGGSIDVKDIIVAMERDPMYCKSTLLYRLMNTQ